MSLHRAIDDATDMVLGLHFRPKEDTLGYLTVLNKMVAKHGVPRSLFSDGHTIFFSPKHDKLSLEDELAGKKGNLTQFWRVLEELGMVHVRALSPQAKGRVERLWHTLQHRLVVELRLINIRTLQEANSFLEGFTERFNQRFAVTPAEPEPAFGPAPSKDVLDGILCLKEERKASKGSTISFARTTYQLVERSGSVALLRPGSTVFVLIHLDGSLSASYNAKGYGLKPLPTPDKVSSPPEQVQESLVRPQKTLKLPKRSVKSSCGGFTIKTPRTEIEKYLESKRWRCVYSQR
ncbi:MAG: hypothetical protein ACOX2S_02710 [bacterium]|jgi:hypothetical protein